jgi:hypothetical protein
MKVVNGRYIKEQNDISSALIYGDSNISIPENNTNNIMVISMYLDNPRDKKSLERMEICNLLSRRFCQVMQSCRYKDTIDRFLMKMFRKLFDELYFLQIPILSSNKPINGQDMMFVNLGDSTKVDIHYNLIRSEDDIQKERELLFKNKLNEMETNITSKLEINKIKVTNSMYPNLGKNPNAPLNPNINVNYGNNNKNLNQNINNDSNEKQQIRLNIKQNSHSVQTTKIPQKTTLKENQPHQKIEHKTQKIKQQVIKKPQLTQQSVNQTKSTDTKDTKNKKETKNNKPNGNNRKIKSKYFQPNTKLNKNKQK